MEVLTPAFTMYDRCERCGARAHLRAEQGTTSLLFCAHHGREHHARLVELGWAIEVD